MRMPTTAIARASCQHRKDKASGQMNHRQADIAAEQIERPVRQVQNLHQSVNEGKARGQQEQQHPKRDAVESLDDPKCHRSETQANRQCGADYERTAMGCHCQDGEAVCGG